MTPRIVFKYAACLAVIVALAVFAQTPETPGSAPLSSSSVTTALGYTPMRGSNNLSEVTVAATARANIGAAALTPLVEPNVPLTDNGTTIATNAALGNQFRVAALTANVTLSNPTNPSDGQNISWEVIQHASAAKTLAFGNQFAFGAEITACTISSSTSTRNFITALYNSTTTKWYIRGCITGY